jgi:hypothetical protein
VQKREGTQIFMMVMMGHGFLGELPLFSEKFI